MDNIKTVPKAVIFDWDNTLIDTSLSLLNAINNSLKHFNKKEITLAEFHKSPPIPMKLYFETLFDKQHIEEANRIFHQSFTNDHLQGLRVFRGVTELLEFLSRNRIFIGIVSNKERLYLQKEITHLGWDKYFPYNIACDDTNEPKPSALPLLTILKQAGINPGKDVWFVGDSKIDMICANNAKCLPVAINNSAHMDDFHMIKISGFQEILNFIIKLQYRNYR